MKPISFKRQRFPVDVIRQAARLHGRFGLSFRDVEELLAKLGVDVSHETIGCWTIKCGPPIARRSQRRRPPHSSAWHLNEMVCRIGGKRMFLWRNADDEDERLDVLVQRRRATHAALMLLKQLRRYQLIEQQTIATDGLASYGAAPDLRHLHRPGRLRENNRAENSHLRIRRVEQQQRFKS